MNVPRFKIYIGRSDAQHLLQRCSYSMNATRIFAARIGPMSVLLGVDQQDLPRVIICHAIDRPLGGQWPHHIIPLPEQPLRQDRFADLPLLLSVIRQETPGALRAALCGSWSACTSCCAVAPMLLPANLAPELPHNVAGTADTWATPIETTNWR